MAPARCQAPASPLPCAATGMRGGGGETQTDGHSGEAYIGRSRRREGAQGSAHLPRIIQCGESTECSKCGQYCVLSQLDLVRNSAATTAGTIAAAVATQTVHPNSAPKKVVSRSDPQRPSAAAAPPDPIQSHFSLLSGNSYIYLLASVLEIDLCQSATPLLEP